MCRFVACQGHPVLIADVLYRPRHSLVQQSRHAGMLSQPFDADGFGVGWYVGDDPSPCVMRSTAPAWSHRSLASIAQHTSTTRNASDRTPIPANHTIAVRPDNSFEIQMIEA